MPDWKGRTPLYLTKEPDYGKLCNAVVAFIFGCVMMGIGHSYGHLCQNGAATFLFYGGLIKIISNIFSILLFCFIRCAEKDGVISGKEYCGIGILSLIQTALWIGNLVVIIWGTIVVFGNYSTWTYEAPEEGTPTNMDYCDYTPFMFAFVLLILDWIILPFFVCCICAALCGYGKS